MLVAQRGALLRVVRRRAQDVVRQVAGVVDGAHAVDEGDGVAGWRAGVARCLAEGAACVQVERDGAVSGDECAAGWVSGLVEGGAEGARLEGGSRYVLVLESRLWCFYRRIVSLNWERITYLLSAYLLQARSLGSPPAGRAVARAARKLLEMMTERIAVCWL